MREIDLTLSGRELARAAANEVSLWWTPAGGTPYWAARPSWAADRCLLTAAEASAAVDLDAADDREVTIRLAVVGPTTPEAAARAAWVDDHAAVVVLLGPGWSVAFGPPAGGPQATRSELPDGELRVATNARGWLVAPPAGGGPTTVTTTWVEAVRAIAAARGAG